MKSKHLFLTLVALLLAGSLWLAWSARRADSPASAETDGEVVISSPSDNPKLGEMEMVKPPNPRLNRFEPPNPNRKFENLTPEERVKLARKGPIGG